MKIAIPKESLAGETRVACTPATVAQLQKLGFAVVVERGAGQGASFADAAYEAAGATLADAATVWQCPLIYKVNAPNAAETARLAAGQPGQLPLAGAKPGTGQGTGGEKK